MALTLKARVRPWPGAKGSGPLSIGPGPGPGSRDAMAALDLAAWAQSKALDTVAWTALRKASPEQTSLEPPVIDELTSGFSRIHTPNSREGT
jgi:hypothetical protein